MQRLVVKTQTSERYYLNGRRVTLKAYRESAAGKRLECFQTKINRAGTIRQYSIAREA
jgi:hypothetical protein